MLLDGSFTPLLQPVQWGGIVYAPEGWVVRDMNGGAAPISATLGATLPGDTLAAASTVGVTAGLAATLQADTLGAAATVGVHAQLAKTLGADVGSGSASVGVNASLAATLPGDSLVAYGSGPDGPAPVVSRRRRGPRFRRGGR